MNIKTPTTRIECDDQNRYDEIAKSLQLRDDPSDERTPHWAAILGIVTLLSLAVILAATLGVV